ncbi:PilN domain-containing protein [Aquicella lusitana]|uniref:Uncharacterized protein n=1 Tax=Aquicella lusitana TaxID=254246 RepID=A0A370GYG5_9COXI|nr:PilN domain-containing protein [Aquicella lusitana]RDI48641.1 hypothetical protein C8D86_10269 [Aquicella lusitana]VVC73982.1 hypothetical protein AQULUS_17440 [Aquicella lusitana]
MVAINLLPWREKARIYRAVTIRKMLVASVGFALLVVFMLHLAASRLETNKRNQLIQLESALARYPAMQDNIKHKKSMAAVQERETNDPRQQIARQLLMELGRQTGTSVCFSEIVRANQNITFSGYARTASDLTQFLKNWHAAYLFSEIKIEQLEYDSAFHSIRFRFQAKQENLLKDE